MVDQDGQGVMHVIKRKVLGAADIHGQTSQGRDQRGAGPTIPAILFVFSALPGQAIDGLY